jgi:hypothetical protein
VPLVLSTLTGQVPDLVYTPNPNFHGSDQPTFEARYRRARAETAMTMVLHSGNRLPIALDEVADLDRRCLQIRMLANDRDPDGNPLQITGVSQPRHGEASWSNGGQAILCKVKKGLRAAIRLLTP